MLTLIWVMKMNTNNVLNSAFDNFKKVCMSNNKKFIHLDKWLYIESKIFESELKYKSKNHKIYKLGDIVKIEYGVNIGSEISNRHFGIVLTCNDNIKNKSIITIPLTSKPGKGKIMIGMPILKKYIYIINDNVMNISIKHIDEDLKKIKKLINLIDKYFCISYANPSQIRAIDKNRILPLSNISKNVSYRLEPEKLKLIYNVLSKKLQIK